MRGIKRARICAPQAYRPVELNANPQTGLPLRTTSVITATTEVVISLKSKLELASVDFNGIAVSRMSTMRIAQKIRGLLNLRDVGVLDHLAQHVDIFFDVGGKLLGLALYHVEANLVTLFFHVRQRHCFGNLATEQVDNRFWRSGRQENALHGLRFLTWDTRLRHGRYIGQRGRALGGGDSEAAQ